MHWVLSPEKSLKAITATTAIEAYKSVSAPIATLGAFSPQTVQALLTTLINDLADYLNIGKNLTGPQVVQTVNLIRSDKDLASFKIEDFKVCFDEMKRGKYGKFYDRLDGQIIFECLYKYANERADAVENISIQGHQDNGADERKKVINPVIAEVLKQAIKEIPEEGAKIAPKPIERDPRITEIFAEFDKLWATKSVEMPGGRWIEYQGKVMNQNDFLEFKLGLK